MKPYAPIPERAENAARIVVDAAYQVHSELGPGLLESVYEVCLCHEIRKQGVQFMNQVSVPVVYDGIRLDAALRLDVLVDNCLVVELKAVEAMIPLYTAQLLTYLKLTGHRLGLLINFNVPVIKEGIRRVVL
ncbi:MAG TPA: GxxExxY protein [bacterium]|nr:GxxExxY protein [bacterium]HQL63631.1 GxxExxY protein [bacterium]